VLALVSAAIALQLVRAIGATGRRRTLTGAPISVVLIFGTLSLAFLLPGALMLLYRRRCAWIRGNGQIVDRHAYLGYGRTRCYPLASFKTIVLARRQIKRRRALRSIRLACPRTYRFFVVELASGGGKPVRMVTEAKEEPARAAATKLASLTRLTVADEVERERAREAAGLDEEDDTD
jgi:hypothetical protein